jgi:YesN/AraC family two-component response regulator
MYTAYTVDDDYLMLEEMKDFVPWQEHGFELIGSATDPLTALDEVTDLKPDVIFVDLKLPRIDGNKFIEKVHELGMTPVFVMVSGYDDFEGVRTFFKQNGFDYILKPIDSEDIGIVLRKIYTKLSANDSVNDETTDNPIFNRLILYVKDNYTNNISLDDLSREFGYNRNYICNMFSKYLNTSFSKYVTKLRMEKAVDLLNDNLLMKKEIANKLGYKDYYHFYKVFKEYFGYAPGKHNSN